MKKIRTLMFLIMTIALVLNNMEPVLAFAPTPSSLQGSVKTIGATIPNRAITSARINDVTFASTTETTNLVETYTLTVTLDGTGAGTVTSSPTGIDCGSDCSEDFDLDSEVTLTAEASTGSTFTSWGGACSGDGDCNVTMDAAKAVTATFTINSYTLTITKDGSGSGTVISTPAGIDCGTTCVASFTYNTMIFVTATADEGSTFIGWNGAVDGWPTVGGPAVADTYLTATFELNTTTCYALSLGHTGQGSDPVASPANSTGCSDGEYLAGQAISLSGADPEDGWEISGWTGTSNNSSTAATNSLTMPASDHAVGVTYTEISTTCYTLTLGHTGQGSDPVASPPNSTGCSAGEYVAGQAISLSGAVPTTGWQISGWTGTANNSSTAATNSLNMPASDHAAGVTYTVIPPTCYELTLGHTGQGSDPVASPPNSTGCSAGEYVAGQAISLSGAVPTAGWQISGWTGTANNSSTASTNSLNMPASDHSAGVTYTVIPPTCYELTLGHTGQGSDPVASPPNSTGCSAGEYVAGQAISLSGAVPTAGWQISGWTGTANNSSTASTNSLNMPASDHSAGVTYTVIPPTCYELTLGHTGQGSDPVASPPNSTGCSAGEYVAGQAISLSGAVPTAGWQISGWTGTANNSSTGSTNSLTMPASIQAVSVTYTATCYTLTLGHTGQGSDPTSSPLKSPDCSTNGQYMSGQAISLSGADPADDWEISGWTGTANDSSTASTNSLTMPASAKLVSVNYSEIEYTLTVASAHGTVNKSPDQATYHKGDVVQLTAEAGVGWEFASWTGDFIGFNNPISITMDEDKSFTANYNVRIIPGTPTLTSPLNEAYLNDNTPTLTWRIVPDVSIYQIQIEKTTSFTSHPIVVVGSTEFTVPAPGLTDGKWYWRVQAVNSIGVAGHWSSARSFTLDTLEPLAPVLNTPADNASVFGTPTFTWLASAAATIYRFEYDNDAGFGSPYTSGALTTRSFRPPTIPAGTFFWHVQAGDKAGNWSDWSPSRTITIQPLIPAAPALLIPTNARLLRAATLSFTWSSVSYGNTYEIQIDTLSTFPAPLDHTGAAGVTSYTPAPLADGKYYWRVRAINADLVNGPWSSVRSFTLDTLEPLAPVLNTPADNASVFGTPTFTWLASATATAYRFEYDNDAGFGSPYTSGALTSRSFRPPTIPAGTYFWHVQAGDKAGNWSDWSPSRTITIQPLIPAAPALLVPTNARLLRTATPSFTWSSVSYGNTYEIQIDTLSTFPAPLDHTGAAGVTSYTPAPLADGKYYWRVRAINVDLVNGPWSSARSFTLDTLEPLAPVLNTPADNASVFGTPTFTWLASATATAYRFAYDDDAGFGSPYTSGVLTTRSYRPPTVPAGTFYWRVQAGDKAGNWSDWSPSRTITIQPLVPAAPALVNPTNALVTSETTPIFMWSSVKYGYTYEIQIDTVSTFLAPLDHIGIAGVTYFIPASPLTAGKHYWRVRAINADGQTGAWSAARTITITP